MNNKFGNNEDGQCDKEADQDFDVVKEGKLTIISSRRA